MRIYGNIRITKGGAQKEQKRSMKSLGKGFIVAVFVIYMLLAIPFKSYSQPLIVMTAIPFGIVGAILGHIIMGYQLSFISALGIVALSGVVVNDSLVLVDFVNIQYRENGFTMWEAVVFCRSEKIPSDPAHFTDNFPWLNANDS